MNLTKIQFQRKTKAEKRKIIQNLMNHKVPTIGYYKILVFMDIEDEPSIDDKKMLGLK